MRIYPLKSSSSVYTCNSYLILGDWNRLEDINCLVDVGTDGSIAEEIRGMSTGFGKRPVERVICTHNHFDHVGGLRRFHQEYQPEVFAFTSFPGVTATLRHGQLIRCGDEYFEVIHVTGHSNDSICLYCPSGGVLFSGDTPLTVKTPGGSYSAVFEKQLEDLASRNIEVIYPGHGDIIKYRAKEMIQESLRNVRKSHMV